MYALVLSSQTWSVIRSNACNDHEKASDSLPAQHRARPGSMRTPRVLPQNALRKRDGAGPFAALRRDSMRIQQLGQSRGSANSRSYPERPFAAAHHR